jgi:hypothetical protein
MHENGRIFGPFSGILALERVGIDTLPAQPGKTLMKMTPEAFHTGTPNARPLRQIRVYAG